MPKDTFNKLNEEKRNLIVEAFYKEFTLNTFDDASITRVVKSLGISKGSIYQYFDNKLDLYLYLMETAGSRKVGFIENIKRSSYSDFWEYMNALYEQGIAFDKKFYLESHFLHSALNNAYSPSIKEVFDQWKQAVLKEFVKKVKVEIELNLFHNELPVEKMAFMLHQSLTSIPDYLKHFHGLDVEQNITHHKGSIVGKWERNS
jgi:AcrR family transcriptional regulator